MSGGSDGNNPLSTPPGLNTGGMPLGAAPGSRPPVPFPGQPWPNPLAAAPPDAPSQQTISSQQQQQQQQLLQLRLRQQQLQIQQLQAHRQQHAQQVALSPSQHAQMAGSTPPFPSSPSAFPQTPGVRSVESFKSSPPSLEAKHPDTAASPASAAATTPAKATSSKAKISSPDREKPTREQIMIWLSRCHWTDKTIYVARQLLGGSSVNGFLKSTAAVQRIKRQRARQVAKSDGGKLRVPLENPQEEEERLKHETMNVRTAKKIKDEMDVGVQWCVSMHATIRSILHQLDPQSVPPPLSWDPTSSTVGHSSHVASSARPVVKPRDTSVSTTSTGKTKRTSTGTSAPKRVAPPLPPSSTMSAGDPQGSTLRRLRKRRSGSAKQGSSVPPGLVEHDPVSKKRVFTKKDHMHRVSEVLRFRELKPGDHVAARVSSRDLWILARVVKQYPNMPMVPTEFLLLKQAKRDALFSEKVLVKDVEEKEGSGATLVPRPLVLPLPRTYDEAADWGSRLKKGCRVYAMYPNTTSLYPATVTDNVTYCRGEEDIIVVEFDEDERDTTGALPEWHIPARFVTLIPKEFPASRVDSTKKKQVSTSTPTSVGSNKASSIKRRNSNASSGGHSSASGPSHKRAKISDSTDSPLNDMLGEIDYADFDLGFQLDGTDFAVQPDGGALPPF